MSSGKGHYSPATRFGDLIFVSGQLPLSEEGGHDPAAPFERQVERVFKRLFAVLEANGANKDSLLKVNVYLDTIALWEEFNPQYAGIMGEARPARTVVAAPGLHFGYLLEVDAIAHVAKAGA
ncbi:MAG: RidA family protein [Parvularculaceae bacterium]